MRLRIKLWIMTLFTILSSVALTDKAEAKGCGCATKKKQASYSRNTGDYKPYAVRRAYYRPYAGHRHMHGKYKLKIKSE